MALKCPSVDVQLTTFKKYQQAFSDEELLRRVMGVNNIKDISHLFKGIWSLESFDSDKEVAQVVQKAIENAHNYVMKPQKEGGGNNFFDDDIPRLLKEMLEKPD